MGRLRKSDAAHAAFPPATIVALLAAGGVLLGQSEVTFSSGIKVVNVLATVQKKSGEIVWDLDREDFTVLEDARPQAIKYFARQSDLPLTLGLMVDTSMSQRRVMDAERGASLHFLDQIFRETKDRVFLMQFDMAVLLRQPLTTSLNKLDEALAFVDTPTNRELRMNGSGPGTLLYDSVIKASNEIMKSLQGRKALIVLSDGVDVGSEASLSDAIEAAQRADTLIYTIEFSDSNAYGVLSFGGSGGKQALIKLAGQTGGGFYSVSKKLSIERVFSLIEDELRNQYSIGYVSDKPCTISEFRKIQLVTKQKGLAVQARTQYWAQP